MTLKVVKRTANNEEGYILIMGMFVLAMLLLMGITLAVMGIQEFEITARTKMMDQAYLIADGGVNAAAVALEDPANAVWKAGKTPLYSTTTNALTGTGPFGGGTFTYTIYQSNLVPNDASYKVVKSKGVIEKNGKKVERILLARIVMGAGGADYDASFDYLFYNGMDSNGDGVSEHGEWSPTGLRFSAIISGNFGFDGYNSYRGHSPKGAFYANGSIKIPTSFIGDVKILGNVVATDDVAISNTWGVNTSDNGVQISNGNVIAGLDGSGSATITVDKGVLTGASLINIYPGKVCAADDVTLTSKDTVTFNNPLVVGGIRAGGKATVQMKNSIGKPLEVKPNGIISVEETIVKGEGFSSVDIDGTITGGGESPLAIFAGGDTTNLGVSLDTNSVFLIGVVAPGSINVGNRIRSNGMVDMLAEYSGTNITVEGGITAGNNQGSETGGTGVNAKIGSLFGWLSPPSITVNGQITSAGSVAITTDRITGWIKSYCNVTTQGIKAGSNGGNGITMGGSATANYNLGNLEAVGNIIYNNPKGGMYNSGGVYAGGNISLGDTVSAWNDIGDNSIYISGTKTTDVVPPLRAVGNATVWSVDNVYIQNGGDITVKGNLDARSISTSILGGDNRLRVANGATMYVGGSTVIDNGNKVLNCSADIGNIMSIGSIWVHNQDPGSFGTFYAGNASNLSSTIDFFCDANTFSGDSYAGNMWASNNLKVHHDQNWSGDLYMGWAKSRTYIRMEDSWELNDDIHTGGMQAPSMDIDSCTGGSQNRSMPDPANPPVATPSLATPLPPDKPPKPVLAGPTDSTTGDVNMLKEAGLKGPVNLLKPNWAYFETLAVQNDEANGPNTKICPNVNCRKTNPATNTTCGEDLVPPEHGCGADLRDVPRGPAHLISENGPGDTGEGHEADGIQFVWDNASAYSSNEVVFSSEPNVNVYIQVLNWNPSVSLYTGTIVARGNVYITAAQSDWVIQTGQTLNIVSGWDIENRTNGINLIKNADANLHLWAQHDINFNYMQISVYAKNSFYGSFTAGDRVQFNSNAVFENSNFKWSRWALDPVAWAPPFKVLEWKEL
jgi:hypothetical protein